MEQISKAKYNAYIGYTKQPFVGIFIEELSFFSNKAKSMIGLLFFDKTDADFGWILLGADKDGRYRAFDLNHSIKTKSAAIIDLEENMIKYTEKGISEFPQFDEAGSLDFLTPVEPEHKLHPSFKLLLNEVCFTPAKHIISIMMRHYIDIDGNFVQQFQTTGFDSRIWELYLFNYLKEELFFIERDFNRPDFMVNNGTDYVAIEAVTVGRKSNDFPKTEYVGFSEKEIQEKINELENDMPIRFGSALYTKMKKEYWKLAHVKNRPLIFAIADFHENQSMLWSSSALTTYLYGLKPTYKYDENGKLEITRQKIESHSSGKKTIPSGFFFQDKADEISGILFSSTGTISKYNRMGRYAGLGESSLIMIREGVCHNHDPNSVKPIPFRFEIKPSEENIIEEIWADGLSLYHNPNAKKPINMDLFPSIAHHFLIDGQIVSYLPDFHPYISETITLFPKD